MPTMTRRGWVLLLSCGLAAAGQSAAQVRTSPTVDSTPKIRQTSPSLPFDKAAAEAALAKGHATITGSACAYHDNRLFLADNRTVMLFPATPYFEQWAALRKKSDRSKESVLMSDPAFNTRVETKTDASGAFQFTEMLPGRYILVVPFQFNQAKSRDVYAGSSYSGAYEVEHYDRQDYSVARDDELFKDVEVKSDGSIVKTAVTSGGGLVAKMLPCKGGK
ncbi:MAG: carboxypeptidase-like regulatory domain-containing protein [Xanthomonas sp.]